METWRNLGDHFVDFGDHVGGENFWWLHDHMYSSVNSRRNLLTSWSMTQGEFSRKIPTPGLLATDHIILNHGQVTWTAPELAPPLLITTPHQCEDVSALDRFNVHRCPTRRVFSGTGLELVTRQATIRYLYHPATAATRRFFKATRTRAHDTSVMSSWAVGSLVVRASDSRPEGLGSMLDVTKYHPSAHGFTCRNCGGGDRGRVAIYRPFGEVSLSLIALSPVWCSRPTTGVPLAHATMNFVGLVLTTSDRSDNNNIDLIERLNQYLNDIDLLLM
ncbi:uncharacterized protein TNCV_54331 [Trichonephila clavipes]|nr:uncharacterized protein TNCV_54331 [Trichonephila clavipes]